MGFSLRNLRSELSLIVHGGSRCRPSSLALPPHCAALQPHSDRDKLRTDRTNHRQEERSIPPKPYARMRVTSPSVEAIANMEIDAVQKKRVNIAMAPVAPNAIATRSTATTATANFRLVLLF